MPDQSSKSTNWARIPWVAGLVDILSTVGQGLLAYSAIIAVYTSDINHPEIQPYLFLMKWTFWPGIACLLIGVIGVLFAHDWPRTLNNLAAALFGAGGLLAAHFLEAPIWSISAPFAVAAIIAAVWGFRSLVQRCRRAKFASATHGN